MGRNTIKLKLNNPQYIMKRILFLLILISLFPIISSVCEEGQVDINNASAEELDKIVHVGQAVAGYIIDARPFSSLDELVNVSYISEGYLEDIKLQGLACVNGETQSNNQTENETIEEDIPETETDDKQDETTNIIDNENRSPITSQTINLNPKIIKREDNSESLSKSGYAFFGFVTFCVLLALLFMLKRYKYKKNGFEE